jgi:bifunctional non-homologous end joining protein LigD
MRKQLGGLAGALPKDVQLDGELVAWGADGQPDLEVLGRPMLHGDLSIPVTYMVFDVLACEGLPTTALPYVERRALLEELELEKPGVQLVPTYDDGLALFRAVCERGLEGVVAKRQRDAYRPWERLWVTKNRATEEFAAEPAGRSPRRRGAGGGRTPSAR